jgi:hypothetical protein
MRPGNLSLMPRCTLDLFYEVEDDCLQFCFRLKAKGSVETSKKKNASQDVFKNDVTMSDDEIMDNMFVLHLSLIALIYVDPISVIRRSCFLRVL